LSHQVASEPGGIFDQHDTPPFAGNAVRLADRPGSQKNAQTALKSLEKWAIVRDLIPRPITLGTEAPGTDGGHIPWTDEQVGLAELRAAPYHSRVVTMTVNTGQRGSDLVRMRWTDLQEHEGVPGINVTQTKTGLKIWTPFTQDLIGAVAMWERRPGFILLKRDGQPFSNWQQLSDHWIGKRDGNPELAPLRDAGMRIHGLRGTAVVRLRRGGATIPQISDMVGMSEQMVKHYCRYSEQRENALAAVHVLDRTAIERSKKSKLSY
jgi:integrase